MTLAAPFVGLLLVELTVRFFLLTEAGRSIEAGGPLREPAHYAAHGTPSESTYWELLYRLQAPEDRWGPPFHPELGWVRPDLDPVTLEHPDAEAVGARRPVLLFGSSYVSCIGGVETCFPELLERSSHGGQLALLNYAVTGYGLGQIALELERALEHLRARDPVVVIAIQADQDLDRATLSFRHGPKPSFAVDASGALTIRYPSGASMDEHLETHPVVRSYAWNYLVHGTALVPPILRERLQGRTRHRARVEAVVPALLRRMREVVGPLDGFVIELCDFQTNHARLAEETWRRSLLERGATDAGFDVVSVVAMLRAATLPEGPPPSDFALPGNGHPNQAGIDLIYAAIERGLDGDFDRRAAGPQPAGRE